MSEPLIKMSTGELSIYQRVRNRVQQFTDGHKVMRTRRLPGGITPPDHKQCSLRSRLLPAPVPETLVLPLIQHQGQRPRLLVQEGDTVLKGQALAEVTDLSSLALHAPTSGTISHIKVATTMAPEECTELCVFLNTDGEERWTELDPCPDWQKLDRETLISRIHDAGISGMGGAGFPTFRKIFSSFQQDISTVIVNAIECEPYISADEALLREYASQVIEGCKILAQVCGSRECYLALEEGKADAISAVEQALTASKADIDGDTQEAPVIHLVLVPSQYPAGGEKQVIQAITGKEVPQGKLPSDLGILLQNVGTIFSIYDAVVNGVPCISRITTVTGSPLRTPKNFHVLIGTPVAFMFDICGIEWQHLKGAIMGGAMMGKVIHDVQTPITKITNCLIAVGEAEYPAPPPAQACIRCGYCADACPVKLLPQQLLAYSRSENHAQLEALGLTDCIECGACEYACPSHIPLVQIYQHSKQRLDSDRDSRSNGDYWRSRFNAHQRRRAQERQQKQAQADKKTLEKSVARMKSVRLSDDQAKSDIAAAVARVKAKREAKN